MAKTPAREAPKETEKPADERTPLERMTDLTQRVMRVPKSEVVQLKRAKRGKRKG